MRLDSPIRGPEGSFHVSAKSSKQMHAWLSECSLLAAKLGILRICCVEPVFSDVNHLGHQDVAG